MAVDDDDGFRSERDFMDALRVLKARSGLSYRDIATRMSRTEPRHAMARSTLASLLAGNSVPRRPGQAAALVGVLAAELNEPTLTSRYMQAWSLLIAARGDEGPAPTPPTPSAPLAPPTPLAPLVPRAPAARPVAVLVRPPDPLSAASTSPPEDPFSGRQMGAFLFWLALLTIIAVVIWGTLPSHVVPFWLVWLLNVSPLLLAVPINWLARDGRRRRPNLSEAPAEYLRTEYRDSRSAARRGLAGRWPG